MDDRYLSVVNIIDEALSMIDVKESPELSRLLCLAKLEAAALASEIRDDDLDFESGFDRKLH